MLVINQSKILNWEDSFLELFDPLQEKLWRYCLSISRNREEAKEIYAETVALSYENFDKLREGKAFLSFLFTIASRVRYDMRKKAGRMEYLEDCDWRYFVYEDSSAEDRMEIKALYDALDKLPFEMKEAILLFDIYGFSRKEVAEIQGTTLANVKIRLFRGRNKLKKILMV